VPRHWREITNCGNVLAMQRLAQEANYASFRVACVDPFEFVRKAIGLVQRLLAAIGLIARR
jgi:hypothetical protein